MLGTRPEQRRRPRNKETTYAGKSVGADQIPTDSESFTAKLSIGSFSV